VAALAVSLAEMLNFGEEFADGMIRNAKTLARYLDREGFDVLGKKRDYTMSHQVVVNAATPGAKESLKILENCNIMCSTEPLPKDFPGGNPSGLRFGTTDVTRLGMSEGDMREIASFVRRGLIDREDPGAIAQDVTEFMTGFREIKYCL